MSKRRKDEGYKFVFKFNKYGFLLVTSNKIKIISSILYMTKYDYRVHHLSITIVASRIS